MSDSSSAINHLELAEEIDVDSLRRCVKICQMPMSLFNLQTQLMEYVNLPFAQLLGYAPEELEGMSPRVLYLDQGSAGEHISESLRILHETSSLSVERILRHKKGHEVFCNVHGSLMIRHPVPYALMMLSDTTARHQAELEQRMLTARFTALFDNMPAGVVFADRETGSLTLANKHAEKLLGKRIDPRKGFDSYVEFYGLEREDGTKCATEELPIPRVVRTGDHVHIDDLFVHRPDGSRIQIEVWAGPVDWSGEEDIDAVVAVFQDITKRKENERALHFEQARQRELQEQIHRDEKMRSIATLAGGVAHDFNNILVSVLGNASLIKSELKPDDKWYEQVSSIISSAERAAMLTKQLLAYSHGGSSTPRPISLREVIEDSLPLCRSAVSKDVEITFAARTGEDVVHVDPTQLQQILLNLTINAGEAMPEGGTISIFTKPSKGPKGSPQLRMKCVALHVKDHGCGIEKEIKDKIYEPFFTTKGFGRGLGLASVFGVINIHGAQIRLDSKPGKGAEFVIYFPLISK